HLTAGMFEAHDRSRFAVTIFSTKAAEGIYRSRIAKACEQFVDAEAMGENELAALIRTSEIDILIDMNGYTANNRAGVLAARPAPVQVNYLGYPGTSGASYIDYLIADRHIIPETSESAYSEKIVRLSSYQPNDSKRKISGAPQTRAGHGLPP